MATFLHVAPEMKDWPQTPVEKQVPLQQVNQRGAAQLRSTRQDRAQKQYSRSL